MTHFSAHYLPDFQDIREYPAIRKALEGGALNAADKMALELRAAQIESAVLCIADPLLSATHKAIEGGFIPKESLDVGFICDDADFAYMAVEDAAEALRRYRHLDGLVNRGRLLLTDDEDALHEFQSLQTQLQYLAGNLLDVDGGWGDIAEPDVIVAEHIERFYSGVREGGEVDSAAHSWIAKKFRHGQEQAALEHPSRRRVVVSYEHKAKDETEGVFKVEEYPDVHGALEGIHRAFAEAGCERYLSNVEVAFADGEFLPRMPRNRGHIVPEEAHDESTGGFSEEALASVKRVAELLSQVSGKPVRMIDAKTGEPLDF